MNTESILNRDSVVLVSGGGRGITARCVVRLAQEAQCRFILLGRSPLAAARVPEEEAAGDENALRQVIIRRNQAEGIKQTPAQISAQVRSILATREVQETLRAVEAAGGKVLYLTADVTNQGELQEKVRQAQEELGAVTGIIHGAGNLADKLLDQKTGADYEKVFDAKVNGLTNLLSSVVESQLRFLVLFSSIVGFYGNSGQADYAMANEILNKFAYKYKKDHPACRVLAMGWGPWDGGMVTPGLRKAFQDHNVRIIPSDAGADLLVRHLTSAQDPGVQILVGDPPPNLTSSQDSTLRSYQVRRHLSLDDNPFLLDHQIGSHPVLPATCAAVWVASACEQLNPQHTFVEVRDYKVLKGIVFDGKQPEEFVLDLTETRKTAEGDIHYDAVIWSTNARGRKVFNYSLSVGLSLNPPVPPRMDVQDQNKLATGKAADGSLLYQNGTLFHGPSFRGVEKVLSLTKEQVILRVVLPRVADKVQGQFRVQTGNPFVYDAIVQSLLIWAQEYYKAPCLPSSMERLEQFKAIPFDQPMNVILKIVRQSETAVLGDIVVLSQDGEMYVRITNLLGTISPLLNRLIGARI